MHITSRNGRAIPSDYGIEKSDYGIVNNSKDFKPGRQCSIMQLQSATHQHDMDVSPLAIAYPAIDHALQRRTAVAALQQRHSSSCSNGTNSVQCTRQPIAALLRLSDTEAKCEQDAAVCRNLADQAHQHCGSQQETPFDSGTFSKEQISTSATSGSPETSTLIVASASAACTSFHMTCCSQPPTGAIAYSRKGVVQSMPAWLRSAAFAAEFRHIQNWRLQRHSAATTIQRAVRSWLLRQDKKQLSYCEHLQRLKARSVINAWKQQVEQRKAAAVKVQQWHTDFLSVDPLHAVKWGFNGKFVLESEGRHGFAAAYHRWRLQEHVLVAWGHACFGRKEQQGAS